MRVAVFVYSLGAGGAERQASLLVKELLRHYKVELVLVHDRIFYEIPDGIKVHILDNAPLILHPMKKLLKLLPLAKKFAKLCYDRNYDVVISYMNRPNYISILSKLFHKRSKIVVSERGSPSYHYSGLEGMLSTQLIRWLYPHADRVVSNSLGNAKDLCENFSICNVQTIYNMFDLDAITNASQESIELEKDRFTFITVGRLDRGKNHKMLIEALFKAKIDADLWIVGEGPIKGELQQYVNKLNLQDRVKFLGKKSNPFAYMTKCDAFVFGSTNEGFPNVLVEALACRLPVISTDCPSGPAEILQDEFGILVPNKDVEAMSEAMKSIYFDANLREKLQSRAIQRAEQFSVDKIMPKWIEVIEEQVW